MHVAHHIEPPCVHLANDEAEDEALLNEEYSTVQPMNVMLEQVLCFQN